MLHGLAVQTFPSGTRGGGNYVTFAKLHGLWFVTFNDASADRQAFHSREQHSGVRTGLLLDRFEPGRPATGCPVSETL